MADTPESVRHLAEEELAEIYTESRKAENTVSAAVDALTRYAELLEQGNARIRELEAQIAEHEKVCAGTWVRCSERLPEDGQEVETLQIDTGRSSKSNVFFTKALLTIPVGIFSQGDKSCLESVNTNESGKWLRVTKDKADLSCILTRAQLAAIVAWMEDEE